MRWIRFAGMILTLFSCGLFVIGCGGPNGPETNEVTGKIVFTKGDGNPKALADRQAIVEFESIDQPGVMAYGNIQEDGSFSLMSIKDEIGSPGIVVGEHRVRLQVDAAAGRFVDAKFCDFQRSGLKVKIEPGQKEVIVNVFR